MLASRLLIALLVSSVAGDQVVVDDDATALLQSHIDVTANGTRSKGAVETSATTAENEVGQAETTKYSMLSKGLAEFVAMALFVFIGCGSAMAVANESGWLFQVSLTFGFAISALAYSIGHISGGQINCAVTFGLVVAGHLDVMQALVNLAFQLAGAVLGSMLTLAIFSEKTDKTGGLGTNAISKDFNSFQAFTAEVWGTFLLVFVVLQTAVNPATQANRIMACMAIGISVFLSHSVLIPVDGCSINPTRSFGPMVVRKLFRNGGDDNYIKDFWVFCVGPLAGALGAAGVYKFVQ
jgi:MIP family channel proteins